MNRLIAMVGGFLVVVPLLLICLKGHHIDVADYAHARECAIIWVQGDEWTIEAFEEAISELVIKTDDSDWVEDPVGNEARQYDLSPRGEYRFYVEYESASRKIVRSMMAYNNSDLIMIELLAEAPEPTTSSNLPIIAAVALGCWCAFVYMPNRGALRVLRWLPLVVSICATGLLLLGSFLFALEHS